MVQQIKVNKWIKQKFWQSIFICLAQFVAYLVQFQHQRCLRPTTPTYTAKFCPEKISGKALTLHYIYNRDIAIALKVVLKQNWVTQKIPVIYSCVKTKLIVSIAKQENWFASKYKSAHKLNIFYFAHIERCHKQTTNLQTA
jgi:hypothetical protein